MGATVAFQDWCATLETSRQPLPCCASHVRLLADGLERLAKPGCHIKSPGHARCFVYTTQSLALLASLARCFLKPTRCVDCVGGEWAQAARSVLRVMCGGAKGPGASTYNDDSQLADYALCTLCLVGACDDGGDSPNRFFDPTDGKGLVDLVANESNVSPDLRDDVRRRLGFGDEAVADLEDIDHQSIELRDVAVLVIAHARFSTTGRAAAASPVVAGRGPRGAAAGTHRGAAARPRGARSAGDSDRHPPPEAGASAAALRRGADLRRRARRLRRARPARRAAASSTNRCITSEPRRPLR